MLPKEDFVLCSLSHTHSTVNMCHLVFNLTFDIHYFWLISTRVPGRSTSQRSSNWL